MAEMTVAELLRRLVDTQGGGSVRQLAAYLDVSPTALDRWVKGISQPDPPYCWKIAGRAKLPICDVMRMAGHLPPLSEPAPEPEIIPELRALLAELPAAEQREAVPTMREALRLYRTARGLDS